VIIFEDGNMVGTFTTGTSSAAIAHSNDFTTGTYHADVAATAPFTGPTAANTWDITPTNPITSCIAYCSGIIVNSLCTILAKVVF